MDYPILIFPNPSSDIIEISFEDLNNQFRYIELLDAKGRIIKVISDDALNTEANNLKFDIKELDLGVYFLQIYLDNNIVSGSFVKK